MANPTGINNFDRFSPEPAYGQKLQQDQLQRAAQMPPAPGINAPRRAQRSTQRRGTTGPNGQPAGSPAPPPTQVNPQLTTAQLWAAIAATPGSSPLVQQIAAEAQQRA